jgi:sRNA-binding protein
MVHQQTVSKTEEARTMTATFTTHTARRIVVASAVIASTAFAGISAAFAAPATSVVANVNVEAVTEYVEGAWIAVDNQIAALLAAKDAEIAAAKAEEEAAAAAKAAEEAAAAKAAEEAAAAEAAEEAAAAAQATTTQAQPAAAQAPAAPAAAAPASPFAWTSYVSNSGDQSAVDACTGGLTNFTAVTNYVGKPYLAQHNHCGGAPILSLQNGQQVTIDGVTYTVIDSLDVLKTDRADVLLNVAGSVLVQTCYPGNSAYMRVVGLQAN